MINEKIFQNVLSEFDSPLDSIRTVAENFQRDLQLGLTSPQDSSLKMLKSYVGLPSGKETGKFLALDFGGTNVRVSLLRLDGFGKYEIIKRVGEPLKVSGKYDYIGKGSTAVQLFDFLAKIIDEAIDGNRDTEFYLGHTFSFPSAQENLNDARLITWTKEFATANVVGEVVNDLLANALSRRGLFNVKPVAVINDTVAVLLAAAYKNPEIFIGSILATGHNTCYLEPSISGAVGSGGMILNLEAGGFMNLTPNRFDSILDAHSEQPNTQRFEKMVSGRYIGELFSLALAELLNEPDKHYSLTSVDISAIISDDSFNTAKRILTEKVGRELELDDLNKIRRLASAIVIRSARLVAASFAGIIRQRAGNNEISAQLIAVDGSVYEKMPLVKENMRRAFDQLFGSNSAKIDTLLENGGSALGAAIAAAMTP